MLKDRRQRISVRLDDALVECFSALDPKSRDEELEDVIYFILDIYQFHGIPVASAEVDIDQAVIDLRSALEDYSASAHGRVQHIADPHLFLVLDKNVQSIPWESIPALRGHSVSRIPGIDFLLDRLEYAKVHNDEKQRGTKPGEVLVDPTSVFYVLNPSGDLTNTEARFVDMLTDMKKVGWDGIVGRPPSEEQLCEALTYRDIVLWVHANFSMNPSADGVVDTSDMVAPSNTSDRIESAISPVVQSRCYGAVPPAFCGTWAILIERGLHIITC